MKYIYKNISFLFTLFICLKMSSQDAVHNYGPIQIHDEGLVGFHMNLINDGPFNQNSGLVGFYNEENELTLSGESNPIFYDSEIVVDNGFYIENTMGVLNELNLVSGIIYTPRFTSEVNLNMVSNSDYFGETNLTMVDGYVGILDKSEFTFPIGSNERLRPMTISSTRINDYAKGAYFNEDPNSPSLFETSFDTSQVENESLSISTNEFWHLEGEVPSTVTLTWDADSAVFLLGESLEELKVVGWRLDTNQWEDLGSQSFTGDENEGSITSEQFIPNDYEIITFGGSGEVFETLTTIDLANYYMTPNGDGVNDRLVIEGTENYPNNTLQIFNRYGILVYSKENYTDEFDGISNRESVFSKNSGLASGIYFYIITLKDIKQQHQGYLYLTTYEN